MSFKDITGEPICKSPLNTSHSKYLFSFNRAIRFPDPPKKQTNYEFYNISTWRNNRSTSFGYGSKYDFTKENKDKCQNFYDVPQTFNPNKKSEAPCYTFGVGRSSFEKVYYETNKSIDMNVPGPCKYNYLKPFGHESAKYSLSFRREDKSLSYKSKEPGPGDYKLVGINSKGIYPESTFKNTVSIKFSNSKDNRFDYSSKKGIPGPDKYNIKPLINSTGKIFQSNFKSSASPMIISRKKDLTSSYTNKKCKSIYFIYIIIYTNSSWSWNI
jgi:hypothetical protein